MSIDLHESAAATRQAAKRARKQAFRTVDVARSVDLHVPTEAAKHVARRAARQAAAVSQRPQDRKTKRGRDRLLRVAFGAIAAGAFVGVVVVMLRRMRATAPAPANVAPVPTFATDEPAEAAER